MGPRWLGSHPLGNYPQQLKLAGVDVAELPPKDVGAQEENETLKVKVQKLKDELATSKRSESVLWGLRTPESAAA